MQRRCFTFNPVEYDIAVDMYYQFGKIDSGIDKPDKDYESDNSL